jgi:hypothetical protein
MPGQMKSRAKGAVDFQVYDQFITRDIVILQCRNFGAVLVIGVRIWEVKLLDLG